MKGPITRGTIRTTFVLGLRLVVQAGTLLIVARMLGPDRFGAFAGIAALAIILGTLSTFGTHIVLLSEVSREPTRRDNILCYAVPSTLICGIALLVIYVATCSLLLHEARVAFPVLLAIGVTEMWLQPLFSLPASEHWGLGRIARSRLLATLPLALRLLAAVAVFLSHPNDSLAAYAYGYLIASVVALTFATLTMPAPWPKPAKWRLPTRREVREAAGYAALNITAASPAELDKTLATKLLSLGSAGLYAAAARVIGAATLPVTAMMSAALPRLFREGQVDPLRTSRLLRWIFAAALTYSLTLAAILWFAAPLFELVFGARYDGIGVTLRWLCLAIPGLAMRLCAGNILMAMGKPWIRVTFEVGGLAVLMIASVFLTIKLGTAGMTLALACSEWVMTITGWNYIRRISRDASALHQA